MATAEYHREYRKKNKEKILLKEAKYREEHREEIVERRKRLRQTPKYKYIDQKQASKQRGISWDLTFEEWWGIWQESGHWEERGVCGYIMGRINDEGSYSIDNVEIITHAQNRGDAYRNGKSWLAQTHNKSEC